MAPWLLTLAVYSGLSTNIVLHLGIGAREAALSGDSRAGNMTAGLLRMAAFTVSVVFLWFAIRLADSVVPLGFLEYLIVFPLSLLVSRAWDILFESRFPFLKRDSGPVPADGTPLGAALFATLLVADRFVETLVLSLGFALGMALAFAVVVQIKRRAAIEPVPAGLRGAPITLVAMGILSLVFHSAALAFLSALGGAAG